MSAEDAKQALKGCRNRIDSIDVQIVRLLNERTRVVEQIGAIKRAYKLPVYEPKREDEVFRNVAEHNEGPLPTDAVKRVFERIVDEMRTVQRMRMLQQEKDQ